MDKARIPLAQAEAYAAELTALYEGTCLRLQVAGSIRRRKPDVGDVELCAIPRVEERPDPADLFDSRTVKANLQLERTKALLAEGVLAHRPDKNGHNCCGAGVQRLLYKGFALDIFATGDADAWGMTLLIRTGSDAFNRAFVLQKVAGGKILQTGQRVDGGRLWDLSRPVRTPEETDVFRAVGLPFVEPEDRTEEWVGRLHGR